MSVKDKVIFGLLAVLLAGGGYFQWMASDMKTRMDTLNQNDQEHLDTIDREFREDLRKLNLRFEGRGKHIRKAQEDIIANTDLINQKAAELMDQIEEVQFNLDEYSRITDKKIERTNNNVADLEDSFDSQKRQDRRKFADLEQTLTQLQNQVKELHEEPEEGKKKYRTGIFKKPVSKEIFLGENGFQGDGVGDTRFPGGKDLAVCGYFINHYKFWESELDRELRPGAFGENLSMTGIDETKINIGDQYSLGDAEIEVSQPRQPCHKLNKVFNLQAMACKVQTTGFTGCYFRVKKIGMVQLRLSPEPRGVRS